MPLGVRFDFEPWPCPLLAEWSWVSYELSLYLNFMLCKNGHNNAYFLKVTDVRVTPHAVVWGAFSFLFLTCLPFSVPVFLRPYTDNTPSGKTAPQPAHSLRGYPQILLKLF